MSTYLYLNKIKKLIIKTFYLTINIKIYRCLIKKKLIDLFIYYNKMLTIKLFINKNFMIEKNIYNHKSDFFKIC